MSSKNDSVYVNYLEHRLAEIGAALDLSIKNYNALQAGYEDILLENEELHIKLGLSEG